jgi:dihydrofolate reductase
MGKVFVMVSVSQDGFLAPEGMDLEHWHDATYKSWMARWSALQAWVLPQKFFRENLKFGEGGETGPDNDLLIRTFERTGASVMGKNMFAAGEVSWPEEAPFHTPVFVVTHQERAPWPRPGGTTFHFVNDGVPAAIRLAEEAAGDRDVRVAGGADVIVQALNAGLVDELHLAVSPVFLGGGTALFRGIDPDRVRLAIAEVRPSKRVTHVRYDVSAA